MVEKEKGAVWGIGKSVCDSCTLNKLGLFREQKGIVCLEWRECATGRVSGVRVDGWVQVRERSCLI